MLQEQCSLPIPRQRLQRVLVMAMAELANGFEPYKELLRTSLESADEDVRAQAERLLEKLAEQEEQARTQRGGVSP